MEGNADRTKRTGKAMGEAIHALFQKQMAEGGEWDPSLSTFPLEAAEARAEELESLGRHERELMDEFCSFFDHANSDDEGKKKREVARAREIIDELSMNVNFAALPYGETFLSNAVHHSLGMVELLVEKGADVNLEDEMISECAIDHLLEEEEDNNGGLSAEKEAMKQLLLSKGAKTAEERWLAMAEDIRSGDKENDE